jgi:hypothetical protein
MKLGARSFDPQYRQTILSVDFARDGCVRWPLPEAAMPIAISRRCWVRARIAGPAANSSSPNGSR